MPILTVIQNNKSEKITFDKPRSLSELLLENGYYVLHLCGGHGSCKKCTVILDGTPVLACRTVVKSDCTSVLPQRETMSVLVAEEKAGRVTDNVCLCLDIGTTTLALALVSCVDKCIIKTETAVNPQRIFGADVMSRIEYCMHNGVLKLHTLLIDEVKSMISKLTDAFSLQKINTMYIAGNTAMLHTFFKEDCSSLGTAPYTPVFLNERAVRGCELGFENIENIVSLSGISTFVGADILSGINYVGVPFDSKYRILLDLGTNAEIALFNKDVIMCTAAAAGPCFEGANISCRMSAGEGAVYSYDSDGTVGVFGNGKPKGLCATGLIDVIAEGVRRGDIEKSGYLENDPLKVCDGVFVIGRDIREFQLAKSAIRAATECLVTRAGISYDDIETLFIAGGFSAGIREDNAAFVGLIPDELCGKVKAVNNSCLSGIVKYACDEQKILPDTDKSHYVDLSCDVRFSELFMNYMEF